MLTKLSVLLLFLSAPCLAQQPRIDSIAVDEDKGELVLYGSFQNSASAIVLVDSVSLPVILASDTLIRATIPVSGKGSAGWASITTNGNQSNKKLLTYIHFYSYYFYARSFSNGPAREIDEDTIHIRLDIINTVTGLYPPSSISRIHKHADGPKGTWPNFDTVRIFHDPIYYDAKSETFSYTMPTLASYFDVNALLDKNYQVIEVGPGPNCTNMPPLNECEGWKLIDPTNFPPSNLSVHEPPSNPSILQAILSSDPINSNANVIISLQNPKNIQMQIMDILGHIISSNEKMLQAGMNKLPINPSALASGMYICRLKAGGEVVSVRFVKE